MSQYHGSPSHHFSGWHLVEHSPSILHAPAFFIDFKVQALPQASLPGILQLLSYPLPCHSPRSCKGAYKKHVRTTLMSCRTQGTDIKGSPFFSQGLNPDMTITNASKVLSHFGLQTWFVYKNIVQLLFPPQQRRKKLAGQPDLKIYTGRPT
jgi:hypothetical protein